MGIMDFKQGSQHPISTVIGVETKVIGKIEAKGSCRVDGILEGTLFSDADVYVAEKAEIKGDVKGKNVVIAGQVCGNVFSEESVEIKKGGKVSGDISGMRLLVDEGASYKGKVTMGDAKSLPESDDSNLSEKLKEIIGI